MGQTSSTTNCPTTTRCPTCPTCTTPVPTLCPSLKLLYIENVTDNRYTAYWSSSKSDYASYTYILVLSNVQDFSRSGSGYSYSYRIENPIREDPLLSANYNSKNFVSNIDNFNTLPVFYAKMQMLDSSLKLVEESNVVEITKIRFDSLTFQTQNDPTKVGQFKFNIVFSLSKIFRDMLSQKPMNIQFSVNTSTGIDTYSYPLDTIILGNDSQVRSMVSYIANLGNANVIPVYARLFTNLDGKNYYSNYLKPISI